MTSFGLLIVAFLSVFVLPHVAVMLVAIVAGFFSPLVPFAVGMFSDLLYLPPHSVPMMTLWGALASAMLYAVQRFVKTSIIDY